MTGLSFSNENNSEYFTVNIHYGCLSDFDEYIKINKKWIDLYSTRWIIKTEIYNLSITRVYIINNRLLT